MRSNASLCAALLWRPRRVQLLLEIPAFAAAGAIVLFFLIFPFKRPLDAAGYFHAAAFSQVTEIGTDAPGPAGSLVVDILDGVPAGPPPQQGRLATDSEQITPVQLVVTDQLAAYSARVLGDNAPTRLVDGGQVFLDAETALQLGVVPGDDVVLALSLVTGTEAPLLRVAGLIPPFASWTSPGQPGQLVVEAASLSPSVLARVRHPDGLAEGSQHRLAYDAPTDARTRTRAELRDGFLLAVLTTDQLLPSVGIIALSLVLWLAVAARIASQSASALLPASALLVALGSRPTAVAAAVTLPYVGAAVAGSATAMLFVVAVIEPWIMRWVIQAPTLIVVGGLLAVAVGAVAVLARIRVLLLLHSDRALGTLVAPEVD